VTRFEYPGIEPGAPFAEDVSLDVRVPQDPVGIELLEHPDEIFKPGIHLLQVFRFQRMGFCPMRPPAVLEHDLLE
jgi:hypothetical protein